MRVRIEAVISTAGNDECYLGQHLGMVTIGRPFKRMVVTFEEEVTEEELAALTDRAKNPAAIVQEFCGGPNAIQIQSFRMFA